VTSKFRILVDDRARRQLAHMDPVIRMRIGKAIDALGADPEPAGCKALRNMPHVLRIRVGDYRILYVVAHSENTVEIIEVGHRGGIYRD
jgi:mRNA interferase RelE/StbE